MSVSSRTDAGVHALMNTGEVDLKHPIPGEIITPERVMKVVNTHLEGEDIRYGLFAMSQTFNVLGYYVALA